MRHRAQSVLLLAVFTTACRSLAPASPEGPVHENLNAVLWMQTSAEYHAALEQAYTTAGNLLEVLTGPDHASFTAALEQQYTRGYSKRPPAVIVDIDDCVLSSLPYQIDLIQRGERFRSESWTEWARKLEAPPVPGALAFVKRAQSLGVAVFYVSNREYEIEAATIENLRKHGFPIDPKGTHLLMRGEKPDWGYDKSSRREAVAASHRIVLLLGDDLNDFVTGARATPADRVSLARRWDGYWGTRWIILPNAIYGGWERATYDFEADLPLPEVLREKVDALD